MTIYVGADHRGYLLKEKIVIFLKKNGFEVVDVGALEYDSDDDDVDYARMVCENIQNNDKGILLCGSGHGVDMAANRYPKIRSILGFNLDVTVQGREHEDANVLALPAEWLSEDEAFEIVATFLRTSFSGKSRYVRRLEKLKELPWKK